LLPTGHDSKSVVPKLIDTFGRKNVYVEIQRHFLRGEERVNQQLCDLAEHHRLHIIATNGVQYARPSGRKVLDVFTCIREHTHLDAAGKLLTQNAERHLKGDAEMRALFRDKPEAITNTERLADRLTFSLENIGYAFPAFPVPDGHSMDSFLRTMTLFGAQQRYEAMSTAVKRKLEEELALITKLGFSGYFLIVWDIVNFCREHDVMVQGTGERGEQRRLLLPRDYAGRSGEQSPRLRALPEREPERLAGYRSRPTERRPARERDPGNLSPLRQTRRCHDRERDLISRQKRRA
jgi:error-prone DNA polymerase